MYQVRMFKIPVGVNSTTLNKSKQITGYADNLNILAISLTSVRESLETVSYTHLDVYKRQDKLCSLCLS